jgi:hypothetical protein
VFHRVAVIGLGTLDSLPHNGALVRQIGCVVIANCKERAFVTLLSVCGSTHRESYRDIVMVGIVDRVISACGPSEECGRSGSYQEERGLDEADGNIHPSQFVSLDEWALGIG